MMSDAVLFQFVFNQELFVAPVIDDSKDTIYAEVFSELRVF